MRGRDRGLDRLRVDLKIIFVAAGNFHRDATRQHGLGLVGHETGRWDDQFIAWVEQRRGCQVKRFRPAHRDDDLGLRVVLHLVMQVEMGRQGLAQVQDPGIGGVMGIPVPQRGDPGLQDGVGVVKSGSPMPNEMTSFIVAAISKNLRIPEGFKPATRSER